ncbi:MAG: TIGR00159 family protein [Clostridiaceae bacterium]|nr:TIGR00159 family protein [Clostridiaceae bacterium]
MDFIYNINLKDLFDNFAGYVGITGPLSVIRAIVDIGLVAFIIYRIIVLVRDTRAWQLIKGIVFILIAAEVSKQLKLNTIAYILSNTISILALAMVVVFQPELRRVLEQIGRSRFRDLLGFEDESEKVKTTAMIEEIVKACMDLSKTFTGALIVIEGKTKIGDIIKTGVQLEANVTSELLVNIFTPNTPLHDGAVVIRDNSIKAAACFLPLTDNPNLSKELGSRHRAALGITEVSDAIAIVVSEESGKISYALNGGLTRNLTTDTLRKALNKNLLEKSSVNKRLTLWKVKNG